MVMKKKLRAMAARARLLKVWAMAELKWSTWASVVTRPRASVMICHSCSAKSDRQDVGSTEYSNSVSATTMAADSTRWGVPSRMIRSRVRERVGAYAL